MTIGMEAIDDRRVGENVGVVGRERIHVSVAGATRLNGQIAQVGRRAVQVHSGQCGRQGFDALQACRVEALHQHAAVGHSASAGVDQTLARQ